ncbi:SIMPL domain-containing protein, partial [Piscibacillus halophilus]
MTVFGEGIVTTEPNEAVVALGVITQDPDLSMAQGQNAELVNNVIQVLMSEGIPREEIQTIDYSIQPQYVNVDGVQQFRGYQVTHILRVTVAEIARVGQVIDGAVDAGANRVLDIQFSVSHPEVFYQ